MQEHIAEFTSVKATASLLSRLTYVHIGNEAFRVPSGYEIIFKAAGAENMNRSKVSNYFPGRSRPPKPTSSNA